MALGLPIEASDVPGLVAATGFLLFGAWLIYLDPANRLHRAFASYVFFRAGFTICLRLGEDVASLGGRMAPYFAIATPFAAAYFALVYRTNYHQGAKPRPTPRQALPFLVAAAALVEILYFVNHDWYVSGWIGIVDTGLFAAFAAFGVALARQAAGARETEATCRALTWAALGFIVETAYESVWQLTESATEMATYAGFRPDYRVPQVIVAQLTWALCLVLIILATALVWRNPRVVGGQKRFFAALVATAMLVAVPLAMRFAVVLGTDRRALDGGASDAVMAPLRAQVDLWIGVHFVAGGLLMLLGLCFLVYSILRHHLFNIEWKLNIAIRGTTLAGIFISLLFVLSEGLQVAFQQIFQREGTAAIRNASSILSVVGAGVVVFALHPVQRMAERLAHQALPNAKPAHELTHPERIKLYTEQAELAWLDGQMLRKERMLLDRLRSHLGLSLEEAHSIETRALDVAGPIGFENRMTRAPLPRRRRKRPARA